MMRKGCLFALVGGFAILILSWWTIVYCWHLKFAPAGLNIWLVLDSEEETWGFGPGGNETGLIVYYLPASAAESVAAGGTEYLTALARAEGSDNDWKETPISGDENWLYRDGTGEPWPPAHRPSIDDFLNRYGFGIRIDSDIRTLVDDALWSPGSFYAYGRGGRLVIIAPRINRVFRAYAG